MSNSSKDQIDPETATKILKKIRGTESMCGCGKALTPIFLNGKRIGSTHITQEDEDFHCAYFTGKTINDIILNAPANSNG